MKGTCCKCGCTDARACPDGCSWIDTQEDLCSRCAAAVGQLAFIAGEAFAATAAKPVGQIWTPE